MQKIMLLLRVKPSQSQQNALQFRFIFQAACMHYFSISAPDGEHLGFLVMSSDEDSDTPQSGEFALKLQAVGQNERVLRLVEDDERALFWQIDGDKVWLRDSDDETLGHIRQEWLTIHGHHFLLTDLTGTM